MHHKGAGCNSISMSLERLIKLAQKTGGTLIIQGNEKERDVVVVSVDDYEWLAENQRDPFDNFERFDRDDVRELSEAELLDRINRDIGIWRANKDQEEQHMREEILGEDFPGEPEWYRAGDIIGDRYADRYRGLFDDEDNDINVEDIPDFGPLAVEDIPFETGGVEKRLDVPFEPHTAPWNLEEHPLEDEEPIFFEEPVE